MHLDYINKNKKQLYKLKISFIYIYLHIYFDYNKTFWLNSLKFDIY